MAKATTKQTQELIDTAKAIIAAQLTKIKAQAGNGLLTEQYSKILVEYVKILLAISKEDREALKDMNLQSLSNEELLKELNNLIGDKNGKRNNKTNKPE